ncbi:MAG: zinc ribbon domain-containing protein [Anaerolineales bacterium]|nr:zinc ribbon domain-containing protein [Anaerolineales bacterium]
MPTYVFLPRMRVEIEELRPMSMADDPMWCPICGVPVRRGLTAAMFIGSSKSSEEDSSPVPASHSFGCPCCAPPRPRKQTVNAAGK